MGFPFPAASGKMKSVLRATSYGTKCPIAEGMTTPPTPLDTLSTQRWEVVKGWQRLNIK